MAKADSARLGGVRAHRQQLQTVRPHEHGFVQGSGHQSSARELRSLQNFLSRVLYSLSPQHLWFPCGVIRGSLASMGISATVQAETSELPAATFQIKTAMTMN